MPQSLSNTLVHIVFSTKNRVEMIDDNIEPHLFGYIGAICNSKKCNTIIVGGYRNHVHIFCSLYRPISQSDLVKEIKAKSSKWIKTQGPQYSNFYWQDGYAIFSVSQSGSTDLIKYIKGRREHHEKKPFVDEYRGLLQINKIEFDELYVWD